MTSTPAFCAARRNVSPGATWSVRASGANVTATVALTGLPWAEHDTVPGMVPGPGQGRSSGEHLPEGPRTPRDLDQSAAHPHVVELRVPLRKVPVVSLGRGLVHVTGGRERVQPRADGVA